MDRRDMGIFGEQKAAEMLLRDGYQILERNYRCRMGEIDIVARTGMTIVFVEVKSRRSDMYGMPADAVTGAKRDHIRRVAMYYFKTHDTVGCDMRFDVIEVFFEHITGAF